MARPVKVWQKRELSQPMMFLRVTPILEIYDRDYRKDVKLESVTYKYNVGCWWNEYFFDDLKTIISRKAKKQFPFRELRRARLPYTMEFHSV